MVLLAHWWTRVRSALRALETSVDALQDGDFAFGLRPRGDELDDLVAAHNRLGRVLREQRQNLMQRELMLDTVVQASPLALLLFDPGGHVVMANLEARRMFADGRRLEGTAEAALLEAMPPELAAAVSEGREGLLTLTGADGEETVHLSVQTFTLNARPHRLLLIKHLTREISRQEVATWKKVIRVISHELNNSLGPMQSLTRSGLREVGEACRKALRTMDVREGPPPTEHPIELMARNHKPEAACMECDREASWLCIECMYDEDASGTLCDEHVEDHPHDAYGEPMPILNSPRTGMCGYTGPAEPPY